MPDDHKDEALDIARGAMNFDVVSQENIQKLAQAYIDARRCADCDETIIELMEKNDALEEVGDILKEAADRDGQQSWVRMEGLDDAIKRWGELKR